MDEQEVALRLSNISTRWTMVTQAHRAPPDEDTAAAQEALVERYLGAIYRYLLGAVRDPDVADELFQEFSLRFVRGDFRNADPKKGRFRDLVKTALINLVINHQKKKRPLPLATESGVEAPATWDPDAEFTARWREELLRRAWKALQAYQEESGRPFHTVLRFKADHPKLSSTELAEQLGVRLGKPLTSAALRQTLHRAREKFAELLVEEVRATLPGADDARVEQELIDLGLFSYCRPATERPGQGG
jgi:RNA polymerase sigma-70 factor (ECF subfamily)